MDCVKNASLITVIGSIENNKEFFQKKSMRKHQIFIVCFLAAVFTDVFALTPEAPSVVQASDGTIIEFVRVNWSDVDVHPAG